MPSYEAVTPQRHGSQSWRPSRDYRFAAADPMATLVVAELTEACLHLPLGFSRVGEAEAGDDDRFVPAALQGLRAGQNLWVDDQGQWLGGYIPAVYRSYPFALGEADDRHVLCINRDSGLISEDSTGEPFFDAEDQPVEQIRRIRDFLSQVRASAEVTKQQCAALQAQALIQPWPLQVQAGEQAEPRTLQGLYRIDEEALNGLSSEAFDTLRQAGALPMIYCQLLSMRHVGRLAALAGGGAKAPEPAKSNGKDPGVAGGGNLDLDFLNDPTIRFN